MSDTSNELALNIYEEDLNEQTTLDLSTQRLKCVPLIENYYLCVLYLQNNEIESLPDDLFDILQNLMYLDVRDNKLIDIPKSIKNHPCLTHLLLQNNQITSLPNELGTVNNLKMLQLAGNPLTYPPKEILSAGISSIKNYLNEKYIDSVFAGCRSDISEETVSINENPFIQEGRSYNSVIDGDKQKRETMSIKFNEKLSDDESDGEYYPRNKGKCPKLAKSRVINPPYCQSSKYLKPIKTDGKVLQDAKIRQSFFRDLAIKKHKDLLATRDKILQGRKNLELLRDWRKTYMINQFDADGSYKMDPKTYPYDTHPDYMHLLSREDIEKDLPDKYKKRLSRRCKPTQPRKGNNDVHLALKIKQLFENLEAIDLNRKDMTPRSEQKMLLNEIQKITEIKQKLTELSTTNTKSVFTD
ncbi:unnamed protein product [Arctia plantaginis]|uniref:Leucine-rich repeat-containing protein 27 n=1 Tax=Arctia plantaginis TaxID=874455 RepID=A0A8S1B528_ARCPL|nr:unnamed protein product [Arctia plantaginis]CAB3257688.1 unnamed protein product [Arctia plantaginis]